MSVPRILIFPGSIRKGSYNAQLAGTIVRALVARSCEVTRLDLRDYPLPIYDANLEAESGPPENAKRLARLFHEHDAVIIVAPEHNASVTPLTKNTVDWISRVRSDTGGRLIPYRDKVFGLASASDGRFAGIRGLYHLRASLMNLGALIVTEQLCVAFAQDAFNENDDLIDERNRSHLNSLADSVAQKARIFARQVPG